MKVYLIPTPEKLFEAVDSMKTEDDQKTAWDVANMWGKRRKLWRVVLEYGRSADLLLYDEMGIRWRIGTMYSTAAKDFVKELSET